MKSDEELYARYKRKSFTEAIIRGDCLFKTLIWHSYLAKRSSYNEICTLMDQGIKPYREIKNHRFEKKHRYYRNHINRKILINKTSRTYIYYRCYSEPEGEECLFLKKVNRRARQILTTIDKEKLTDNDLIPYLKLHNLIKKLEVSDYDDIIRCVAEYCFENGGPWEEHDNWVVKIAVTSKVNHYVKKIMRNIKEAAVVACLEDKNCPYKPLVRGIAKRTVTSILMEEN